MVQVILLAILVEAVLESLKPIYTDNKVSVDMLGATLLGILVTFNFQLDLFQLAGLSETVTFVGIILSGVLVSRGSNFIHDLINKLGDI